VRGDPDFPAVAVGLRAFGALVAFTLDIGPPSRAGQDVYRDVEQIWTLPVSTRV